MDITEEFGMSRSFRRGSDSRAIDQEVGTTTINLNNRWRKVESAKGKAATFQMFEHYAGIELLLGAFLKYSRSMQGSREESKRLRKGLLGSERTVCWC